MYVALEGEPVLGVVNLTRFAYERTLQLPSPCSTVMAHRGSVYALCPQARSVLVFEGADPRPRAVLRLPGAPLTAVLKHGRLWCLLDGPPRLLPVDLAPLRMRAAVPLPASPVSLDISDASPRACIALARGEVIFANLETGLVLPPRLIDDRPGIVRFRSDGRVAIVAGLERRQLILLEAQTRDVVVQLPLALRPERFCFSADGGQLFITGEGSDAVVIAYPYRSEIAQTSLSGRKPGEMAASASPPLLFVSNPQAGSVTTFSIAEQRVVSVTGVGADPGPIYITPDQEFALVLNRASGDMAVIRIPAIPVDTRRRKTAPLLTMIPVGPQPRAAVIVPA
ncbi:MAG: hypothetical protein WHT08_03275 [Bryobacteraceae bacterium]